MSELSKIENFDFLLTIWSDLSRLRQWYNEQIKDIAENNKEEDFDKQNKVFVEEIIQKCSFIFSNHTPIEKIKNKNKTTNFLKEFKY